MFLASIVFFANFAISGYFLTLYIMELSKPLTKYQKTTQKNMKYILLILIFIMLFLYSIGSVIYLSNYLPDLNTLVPYLPYLQSKRIQILIIICNILAIFLSIFFAFLVYFDFAKPNDKKSHKNTSILLNTTNILFVSFIVWLGIELNVIKIPLLSYFFRDISSNIRSDYGLKKKTSKRIPQRRPKILKKAVLEENIIKPAQVLPLTSIDQKNILKIVEYSPKFVLTINNKNNLLQQLDIFVQDKTYYIYIEYLPSKIGYLRHTFVSTEFFKPFLLITRQINWMDTDIHVTPVSLHKERAFLSHIFHEYNMKVSPLTGKRIIYQFTDQKCFNWFEILPTGIQKFGCVKF